MKINSNFARLATLLGINAVLVAAAPATSYGNGGAVYHWPLDWTPLGFIGNHTAGTPPQKITSFVDITWIGDYMLTTKCKGEVNNVDSCFVPGQAYFNESESSTFKYLPNERPLNWNPNHFFFWKDMFIDIAKEVVEVGGVITNTIIQAADFAFKQDFPYPFQAVYGLSPVFKGDNVTIQSPFYQAWRQGKWKDPVTAFHYCYPGKSKKTCQGHDAIQSLGGIETNRIKGDIHWYKNVISPEVNVVDFEYKPEVFNYWAVTLSKFAVGNEVQAINQTTGATGVFDHASYGRGAPLSLNAYARLVQVANATPVVLANAWGVNNGNQTFYEIPCTEKTKLPDLKYWFEKDSKPWVIKSSNYVDEVEGKCVLNVRTLGYGDMIIGNLGETFARDKYLIFDFEKLRVGISDVKW